MMTETLAAVEPREEDKPPVAFVGDKRPGLELATAPVVPSRHLGD